ncbi:hypothetical protein SAMN05444161_1638 [Rhizobiales bacterium GAS191]|nr:hypothetical protein SAMN05444161_1638 [Rhizobiales bacterium GAS191]
MRKAFAIALACATLSACNTANWSLALNASGELAGALAVPACGRIHKTASAATRCVNAANAVITVGEAVVSGAH